MHSSTFPRIARALFVLAAAAAIAAFAAACGDSEPTPTPAPDEPTPSGAASPTPTPADDPEPSPAAPTPTPFIPAPDALEVDVSGRVGGAPGDTAPQFAGISTWINSDPLTMDELRGEIVLIDFWTYTCINCIRTIPYLRDWHEKYADHGLTIVGVHTPEFEFEKVTENVIASTEELGIGWPVAQDNDFRTWRAYNNRYWPAKYLIDADGVVRYTHFGEGAYDETEAHIRTLITEAGGDVSAIAANPDPGPEADPKARGSSIEDQQTREIYGGWNRNASSSGLYIHHPEYYDGQGLTQFYVDPGDHLNQFLYLSGSWTALNESIKHGRATENLEDYLALRFFARTVNIVIDFEPETEPYEVDVTIADPVEQGMEPAYRPLRANEAGEHIVIEEGRSYFVVDEPDLYNAVALPEFGSAELKFASNSPDFALFALTFGSYAETF